MKDINNLYDYNTWSCTEYNNSIEGFDKSTSNIQLIPSNDFSNIGENSLRLNCDSANDFIEIPHLTGLRLSALLTVYVLMQ